MGAPSTRLLAARSTLAEALDERARQADVAMLALHDPRSGSDRCDETFAAWRLAHERVEVATAEVVLQRAVAGQLRVVAS